MTEFGDVMMVVRVVGRETSRYEHRRSGSVLKRWQRQGRDLEQCRRAVLGARLMIDAGLVSWLPPGSVFGLRALNRRALSGRDLFAMALEHYDREHQQVSDGAARQILDEWGIEL
jgi:hypothetical protein